jgi:ribose 5-phosphate isomerase B
MKIALSADHAGVDLKDALAAHCAELGHEVLDLGTHGHESVDYPNFGRRLSDAIRDQQAERGIAVCGSGIGISIAVNREPACRCALVNEPLSAKLSRQHNDANVIALGGRLTGVDLAKACVDAFLTTDFEGNRHQRRVDQLTALGNSGAPTPLEESTHGDRA